MLSSGMEQFLSPKSSPGFRNEMLPTENQILATFFNLDFRAVAGTEIFQVFFCAGHTQNRSFWLTLFPELRIWIRRGDRGHEVVYVANWRVRFNCRNIHTVLS